MDWVNPHGRKNVPMPTSTGARQWSCLLPRTTCRESHDGIVSCRRLVKWNTSSRFTPRINITTATMTPSTTFAVSPRWNELPIKPMVPPSRKKPASLPTWKSPPTKAEGAAEQKEPREPADVEERLCAPRAPLLCGACRERQDKPADYCQARRNRCNETDDECGPVTDARTRNEVGEPRFLQQSKSCNKDQCDGEGVREISPPGIFLCLFDSERIPVRTEHLRQLFGNHFRSLVPEISGNFNRVRSKARLRIRHIRDVLNLTLGHQDTRIAVHAAHVERIGSLLSVRHISDYLIMPTFFLTP